MQRVVILMVSILSITSGAMELDSSGSDLYSTLVDIHTKTAQWNADGNTYGNKKPLSAYEQYRAFDTRAAGLLDKQDIATVGALALVIARTKNAHYDIKRTMADYLFDHGGFGHRVHLYMQQQPNFIETSLLQDTVQETSEEDMVSLDLNNESEILTPLFVGADDKKLYTFVTDHCTSIGYIAKHYPDLIVAHDDTFCVKPAGMRSFNGLANVAQCVCRDGIYNTNDQIRKVCFKDNYVQRFYRQEVAAVFTKADTFICTNNPLHFVDLAGAHQGDTFYLESTCPDGKLVFNMHSLRNIRPINMHVHQSSISISHQNEIAQLLKQMNSQGKLKRYATVVSTGLAYAVMVGLLAELSIESVFAIFALMLTGSDRFRGYSFEQMYDATAFSAPGKLIHGSLVGILPAPFLVAYAIATYRQSTIDTSFESRYRSHNVVFK